ncbi:MAG: ThuA domain-containing protein [Bacteroidia bacterium]
MRLLFTRLVLIFAVITFSWSCDTGGGKVRLLVFSKTKGFRHASIETGIKAIQELGLSQGYEVVATEDASIFTDENLRDFSAVIFLNTTMDVLDYYQQADFERYIQSGGGFVGIHAATDTEYEWPWYNHLVGAYFASHPKIQEAKLVVVDKNHPSTQMLPDEWTRTDEWYNFKDFNEDVHVLVKIDESSYEGGKMGEFHPMAWYHEFDGGRSFYTEFGHTEESYQEDMYLQHLLGGIQYAIGNNKRNYALARSARVPLENRFVRTILAQNLNEPMEIDVLPDGKVLMVERKGALKIFDPAADSMRTIVEMPVHKLHEDGLLGIAVDPNYSENHWIYLFYSPDVEEPKQHVSRFVFDGQNLDLASEKVLLEITVQRDECCHSAGSLEFGPDGNLFISVGDNTNPFASDGFAPIDERPGRSAWDAQRSSANANDLRGKILRITPQPDGTYTIPEGNLFPPGTENTRPEIYVMGCRNPFRISIDSETGYLYWGDVGPDAGKNNENRGPKGLDELDQARHAGFWGWPYTRGNNQSYRDFDFTSNTSGPGFDPEHPVNQSPNNTGIQNLPPIQKSLIWYSYDRSEEFPWVGTGGKNPMAGPVFHAKNFKNAPHRFPDYFEDKIFFYEWIRGWIYIVTLDDSSRFEKAEPFMAGSDFSNPMDMVFSPDGSLYILEYGEKWFAQNFDARLSRIEYVSGNRAPVARIVADKQVGGLPLTVNFSAASSEDFDGDNLSYEWFFNSSVPQSREESPAFTFEKEGTYEVTLRVTDPSGEKASTKAEIMVGNEPPVVEISLQGNSEYFWNGRKLNYSVKVTDNEDGSSENGKISAEDVTVTLTYIPQGQDITTVAQGHQTQPVVPKGRELIDASDCKACHAVNETINGPSFESVAEKYSAKDSSFLISKVINGGAGVWGERMMSAHPQLSRKQAGEMIGYILSLNEGPVQTEAKSLPLSGSISLTDHIKAGSNGSYVLMASYQDQGKGTIQPIMSRDRLVLRYPRLEAEDNDGMSNSMSASDVRDVTVVGDITDGRYMMYKNKNLSGLKKVNFHTQFRGNYPYAGEVEIHIDSRDGEMIGKASWTYNKTQSAFMTYSATIKPTEGNHDLYLVFRNAADKEKIIANLDAIELIFE